MDRTDTEQSLPEGAADVNITDTVKQNFIVLQREETHGNEQPVFRHGLAGEAQRHTQNTLVVFPDVLKVYFFLFCHNSPLLIVFFFILLS